MQSLKFTVAVGVFIHNSIYFSTKEKVAKRKLIIMYNWLVKSKCKSKGKVSFLGTLRLSKKIKKIQLILLLTNQSTVSLQTLIAGPKGRHGGDGSGSAAVAGGLGYWLRWTPATAQQSEPLPTLQPYFTSE